MNNYIFDFDGTLADSKLCSVIATQEAFKEFGLNVPNSEQIEHFMGIPIEVSFKEIADYVFTDESFNELLQIFRKRYKANEIDTLTVFPEIPDLLQELKSLGKQLFVVSSKKSDVCFATYKNYRLIITSMILSVQIKLHIINLIQRVF